MARLRIKTTDEFANALGKVPFAATRANAFRELERTAGSYALWGTLLDLVHDAVAECDWDAVACTAGPYDAVARVGQSSEMFEAQYVAFLEDVRLPTDPTALRAFWRHAPPLFTSHIKADRGLR